MDSDKDERIRARAYAIWMEEGRPHGKHEEHWHRAAREIEREGKRGGPARGRAAASNAGTTQAARKTGAAATASSAPKGSAAKKPSTGRTRRGSGAAASS